jgi:protein-arginine kinase activator protein McsA
MQFLLDQAIKAEDFEKAVELRDEIKKLKAQTGPVAAA